MEIAIKNKEQNLKKVSAEQVIQSIIEFSNLMRSHLISQNHSS